MADLMQQLRLRNLFQGPLFGGQQNREPLFETPEITPIAPMNAPEPRRTPFMDQYRDLLMKAPRREDYAPNNLSKILAVGAGGLTGATEGISRGIETGRGLLERPYKQAVEDYTVNVGRAGELADLEYKTGADERKYDLENRKLIIDDLKTRSGIKLDDARAQELLNRIKTSGKKLEKNEVTGQLEVVDINTGTRQALGQFAESASQKRENEFGFFKKREGVQQANRKELEKIRFGNDQSLSRLKASLDKNNNSATQNNAAFEGAYREAIFNNPGLAAKLFDKDDEGNLVLKDKYEDKDYQTFVAKVNQRMNAKLGEDFNTVSFPADTAPTVDDPMRQAAIEAIKENYPDNPELLTNEEAIQEAMKQIQQASQSQEPTVSAPMVTDEMGGRGLVDSGIDFSMPNFSMPNFQGLFNSNIIPSRERPPVVPKRKSRTQRELEFRGVKNGRL
jgi:hypothetical protein